MDTPYIDMPHLDKRIEVVINAASLIQESGVFPNCCYQMSEAMAGALTKLGIPAFAQASDVYGWNNDYVRYMRGDHIKILEHNQRIKKGKTKNWKHNRSPQRKSAQKPKPKRQIDPYTLALFHEQEVEGGGYDGHVICIADGWILDATSGQFHRPHKNLHSTRMMTIPLDAFIDPPENWKQEWVRDNFMVQTSLDEGLIAITKPDKKSGQFAFCLRPDIEPDNWLNHTETAKPNIEATTKWILEIAEKTMMGIKEFDFDEMYQRFTPVGEHYENRTSI